MGSWELVISGFIALIFTFFFIGFQMGDEKKYIVFKMFFLWLGFTLIIPFLAICQIISRAHIASVGTIFGVVLTVYMPLYVFFCWILYLTFFKDALIFIKEAAKGFKGHEEPDLIET